LCSGERREYDNINSNINELLDAIERNRAYYAGIGGEENAENYTFNFGRKRSVNNYSLKSINNMIKTLKLIK
jgi:hypothetical protein